MKNFITIILLISILISCETKKTTSTENIPNVIENKIPSLEKVWETDTIMKTSESVFYHKEKDILYVSNIGNLPPTAKDNDGFISKLSTTGEVLELNWITGLDAPKGMGVFGNSLFVSNINEVVEIDIKNASIIKRYPIDGAMFLNDITISKDGTVFISDSDTNIIHTLKEGVLDIWLEGEILGGPNGLLHQGSQMMLATYGSDKFAAINTTTKEMNFLADSLQGGDGIVAFGDDYIVSGWNGAVHFITASGEKTTILDTRSMKQNAADIEIIASKNLLLVPTFLGNTVVAYKIK